MHGTDVSHFLTSIIVHLMVKIAGRTLKLTPSGVTRLTSCGKIHSVFKKNLQTFSDKFVKHLPVVIYVCEAPHMSNLSYMQKETWCPLIGLFPVISAACFSHVTQAFTGHLTDASQGKSGQARLLSNCLPTGASARERRSRRQHLLLFSALVLESVKNEGECDLEHQNGVHRLVQPFDL